MHVSLQLLLCLQLMSSNQRAYQAEQASATAVGNAAQLQGEVLRLSNQMDALRQDLQTQSSLAMLQQVRPPVFHYQLCLKLTFHILLSHAFPYRLEVAKCIFVHSQVVTARLCQFMAEPHPSQLSDFVHCLNMSCYCILLHVRTRYHSHTRHG